LILGAVIAFIAILTINRSSERDER